MALHGADPGVIADIDVLLSRADALRLCRAWDIAPSVDTSDGHFRSSVFSVWHGSPLPVEVMADTEVFAASRWHPVVFESRQAVAGGLFVPSRSDLIALLTLFGREKDLRRAASLS